MRFLVDHCVPAEVARFLRRRGHEAWTAFEVGLEQIADDELQVYARDVLDAIAVTTNKDFVRLARRLRVVRVVYLRVVEVDAVDAMARALAWLDANALPDGRVLRVPKVAPVQVMTPLPW